MRQLLVITAFCLSACLVSTGTAPPPSRPVSEGPPPPPHNQGAILTGIVVDARTRQPLNKAAVDITSSASNEHYTVQTGPDGRYTTHPIMPGEIQVRARLGGYEPVNQMINIGSTEARLDFELHSIR